MIRIVPLFCLLLTACGGGSVPDVDCTTVVVPSYASMTVWNECTPCHRSYGSYDQAVARANDAQDAVAAGDMPRSPYHVDAQQKEELYAWAQCGTPR
jgi:hypothetical protein